ncbi:MAG: helix-turn-helix domain-containing protein [Mogibacterium sp.]|nr:helix-turn-helix domain-containing protein [Mogibacterium sp.]
MLSLMKLLQLPPFANARVLQGGEPETRSIRGVTLLDPSESFRDLKNQLVLTGLHGIETLCGDPSRAIEEFFAGPAAALCIRIPEAGKLPDAFLAAVPQSRFPVLLVGPEIAYDQIINAVTFEIFRNEGYSQNLTFEENFLQELIASTQDRETYTRRGAMLGLRHDELLFAVLIQPSREGAALAVCRHCSMHFRQYGYYLTKNDRVLAALRLTFATESKENAVAAAQELLSGLKEAFPDLRFHLGVGRCYDVLADFDKSFRDACCALSYSMLIHKPVEISHFDDLGVYRILFDYKNRRELFELYKDTIGHIREYDDKNGTEYLKTIQTFFEENYSVNNTAKKLYTHYNTIVNRFQKIQTLFDLDMYNESQRINFYVCLVASDSQKLWSTY